MQEHLPHKIAVHLPSRVESDKCSLLMDGVSSPLILFYDIVQQSPAYSNTVNWHKYRLQCKTLNLFSKELFTNYQVVFFEIFCKLHPRMFRGETLHVLIRPWHPVPDLLHNCLLVNQKSTLCFILFYGFALSVNMFVLTLVESISSSSCQGGGCPCLILSSITILLMLKFFATGSSVTKGCRKYTFTLQWTWI